MHKRLETMVLSNIWSLVIFTLSHIVTFMNKLCTCAGSLVSPRNTVSQTFTVFCTTAFYGRVPACLLCFGCLFDYGYWIICSLDLFAFVGLLTWYNPRLPQLLSKLDHLLFCHFNKHHYLCLLGLGVCVWVHIPCVQCLCLAKPGMFTMFLILVCRFRIFTFPN